MNPIPTADLAEALAALDPADRALLELSFRGGMPADEVAEVLGSPETAVVDRREDALAGLAEELGEQPGPELERALTQADEGAWRPPLAGPHQEDEPADDEPAGDEEEAGDAAEPGEPPADAEARPARRLGSLKQRLILLGLAALALGIAGGILIATSKDDSDVDHPPGAPKDAGDAGGNSAAKPSSAPDRPSRPPRRPRRQLGPLAQLEPQIQGLGGTVDARLIRSGGRVRLALRARDLPKPKGNYEVWLLDAPKRALSLARFKTPDFELDARLPRDVGGYQQLDVTVELEDGNRDHSGLSAFRTDVQNLAIRQETPAGSDPPPR